MDTWFSSWETQEPLGGLVLVLSSLSIHYKDVVVYPYDVSCQLLHTPIKEHTQGYIPVIVIVKTSGGCNQQCSWIQLKSAWILVSYYWVWQLGCHKQWRLPKTGSPDGQSHITLGSFYFIGTAGFMSRLPDLTQLKAVVPLLQAQHMLVIDFGFCAWFGDCLPFLILCCSVGGVKSLLTLGSIKELSWLPGLVSNKIGHQKLFDHYNIYTSNGY